jgi:hypothetical protein
MIEPLEATATRNDAPMRDILVRHRRNVALIIGNGINRYEPASKTNSWSDLLLQLALRHLPSRLRQIPAGVALPEFSDVIALAKKRSERGVSLQREFCELVRNWHACDHHRWIVRWARYANAPVLTTNFDRVLADAGDLTLRRTRASGFTDFYPWEKYYGASDVSDPSREFAVWHVNGMEHYPRSVRLGLTDYMGSVGRARAWLHAGSERRLFSGKNAVEWPGFGSWLHVVFNTPLLIFGLALDQDEVFLRWLLIERAKYFKVFPGRRRTAWYVHVGALSAGKRFFFDGVGVSPHQVATYDDIYARTTWE